MPHHRIPEIASRESALWISAWSHPVVMRREGAIPAKLHFGDRDMGDSRSLITRFPIRETAKCLLISPVVIVVGT
jgi:hypothetical protein